MKYLIINPYHNASHGIANYIKNLQKSLSDVDIITFENTKNLNATLFREAVSNYITRNFGYEDVIIEAPEAKASTLLISSKYNVHIRLHCPLAVAQKYDNQKPNQQEFSNELRVIHKAKMVSSPSYALVNELSDEINNEKVTYFKNPINIDSEEKYQKEYDLVFMGRFQELKGTKDINKILERLPSNFKVLLIGPKSNLFKISSNVKCSVEKKGEITGERRFSLIKKSKCLMMPSQFENCSMVILESLACKVPVVCWNVGGNSEIASPAVLKCAKFGDYDDFAHKIIDFVSNEVSTFSFDEALNIINEDFKAGISNLINQISQKKPIFYRGINNKDTHTYKQEDIKNYSPEHKKLRIFGVAFSNEHIEELWAPIIDSLEYDYRYVCRRPLGHHKVFNHIPFDINRKWFCHFDWIKDTDRLIGQIRAYKPNFILFHNGSHPIYKDALDKIKELKIPIIYSELGWFPQQDHIYFDKWGTNGQSYLSSLTAEQLCKKNTISTDPEICVSGKYALLITQLENDTNLIVNSPRFKNNINFIEHVISQIGKKTKIIIKPHPLDKNIERYNVFKSNNIEVVTNIDTNKLLTNAHSVIGINSTVLLQSLEHEVNIYSYGHSILDNKGISIDCSDAQLSEVWTERLVGSMSKRQAVVDALKNKQINLLDVRQGKAPNNEALRPLLENYITDFSHLMTSPTETMSKIAEEINISITPKKPKIKLAQKNKVRNKTKKLIKSPKLFFTDMLSNMRNNDRKTS